MAEFSLPKNSKIKRDGKDKPVEIAAYKRNSKKIRNIRGADISMIFQDPMSALNPVYSIGRQISENLLQHERLSKKEARARVIEMLKDLGIPIPEQRYDEYSHQFSGGMRQRVMIGIAMICNPGILIADEPTTALDVTIQAQILELMKRVQQQHGTSVILITHNMGIVAEACDDVAVMYMGRVVEYGTLEQVFNHLMTRLHESTTNEMTLREGTLQAQLNALQAQINPHFIYNTLNIISAKSMESSNYDVI